MDPVEAGLQSAAGSIGSNPPLEHTLQRIAEAAALSLPAMNHVGVSVTAADGTVTTRAASDDVVRVLDRLQYDVGQGPCVDAAHGEPEVLVPRIRHEQRWRRYVERAVREHGLQAQLAVRLWLDDAGTVGALNVYSTRNDDFTEDDVHLARLFASHAAVAFGRTETIHHLTEALRSRKVIGQALGIVMTQYGIDEDAAFAFLRRASSHANVKLRVVAERLVEDANTEARGRREDGGS